jgi:hypothetical protein
MVHDDNDSLCRDIVASAFEARLPVMISTLPRHGFLRPSHFD